MGTLGLCCGWAAVYLLVGAAFALWMCNGPASVKLREPAAFTGLVLLWPAWLILIVILFAGPYICCALAAAAMVMAILAMFIAAVAVDAVTLVGIWVYDRLRPR